jgi:FtsX-like permease family
VFTLVLHALRARRAQALALFALAVLAGLGAAAAPWFLAWGNDAVARATLGAASETDRLVTGSGTVRLDGGVDSPMAALADTVVQSLPIDDSDIDIGARILVSLRGGPAEAFPEDPAESVSIDTPLAVRTGVCDHLRLVEGACTFGDGELVIAHSIAERLGVGVGDPVTVRGVRLEDRHTLRVAGVYEVADPFSMYWLKTDLVPEVQGDAGFNASFVGEPTLLGLRPNSMDLDLHVALPANLFVARTGLRDTLNDATVELSREGFSLTTSARTVLDRIARDRALVQLGVAVGAGQLVLVSWVGLFLAVRHTSDERRGDIGLLKLRGTKARRVWTVIGLSSGVPMLAGTVVGAIGGFVAAAALAYQMDPDGGPFAIARTSTLAPLQSLWLSLAAAAVAGLGGLIAAVVAEWRTIRTSVVDLLRRIPGGRRGWRADVADLVVVAAAAAGVYQGWVDSQAEESQASMLVLLTPLLVGLAAALLVARALPVISARFGVTALRAGRAGAALAALQLSRRHGTQRVFAVLAVAAAVFTTMTFLWQSASTAWHQRAVQELGADRVLTVDAPSAATLMSLVRSVDPEGRYAMAAARTLGATTSDRVLAVDMTRYAAVGRMPEGLPTSAELARLLRPEAPALPEVGDGPLTLEATAPDLGVPVGLRAYLSTPDGQDRSVEYPSLAPGRHSAEVTVEGCTPACRLVALEVVVAPDAPTDGITVALHELRQPAATVLSGPELADIRRWRTTLAEPSAPPTLSTADGALAITMPSGPRPAGAFPDGRVMPLASPVPLPVATAGGQLGARGGIPRVTVVGGSDVPVAVVREVRGLPGVGGQGVLVDLEYALRGNDAGFERADLAVWLTADAPESIVTALTEHGVTILDEQSVEQRSTDLAGFGPGLALRFEYFTVAIILLLAATVALVGSTVDRSGRVAELVALRGQGLSARAVRTAGLAGTAVMVAAAALTGIVAALLAEGLVSAALPAFTDNWRLLPHPPALTPGAVLLAAGVILVALGAAAVLGAGRLVAAATAASTGAAGRARRGRTNVDGRTHRGAGGAS